MGEIVIKVDVPEGMQDKFEKAIDSVLKKFFDEVKWTVARDIVSKSKLSEDMANKLALEVKESIAKKQQVLISTSRADVIR